MNVFKMFFAAHIIQEGSHPVVGESGVDVLDERHDGTVRVASDETNLHKIAT